MLFKVCKKLQIIFTLLVSSLVLGGCMNITDQQQSGFLKNYEGFEDVYDPDYTKVLS